MRGSIVEGNGRIAISLNVRELQYFTYFRDNNFRKCWYCTWQNLLGERVNHPTDPPLSVSALLLVAHGLFFAVVMFNGPASWL